MIEQMTPQPFPLWLVEQGDDEPMLVLGWVPSSPESRSVELTPVVAALDRMGGEPYATGAAVYALYATRDEAYEAVMAGLVERSRR